MRARAKAMRMTKASIALRDAVLPLAMLSSLVASACSSSTAPATSTDAGGGHEDVIAAETSAGDAGGLTWNNGGKAFFAKYCVECHSATDPDPSQYPNQNFNIYSDVVGLDKTIRCGVAPVGQVQSGCPANGFPPPGQFPIYNAAMSNPKPTDAERLQIIAWIDEGAPEN
jgi:hypothetical protein